MRNFKIINRQIYTDDMLSIVEGIFARSVMFGDSEKALKSLGKKFKLDTCPILQYFDMVNLSKGDSKCYIIPVCCSKESKVASYAESYMPDTLYIFTNSVYMIVRSTLYYITGFDSEGCRCNAFSPKTSSQSNPRGYRTCYSLKINPDLGTLEEIMK